MPLPEARPAEERKAALLAMLNASEADAWVATADDRPYLVPLSFHWTGEWIVLALDPSSRTARNLHSGRVTRLGLGGTRDVVMIDADVVELLPAAAVPEDLASAYAQQSGWEPRTAGGDYVYVVLRPTRIQAWREANELKGRTMMRDGRWTV